MREKLASIKQQAMAQISAPDADLEQIRIQYLGKKGELTAVLRGMGQLSPEERPVIGQLANEVRAFIENEINEKKTKVYPLCKGIEFLGFKFSLTDTGKL